ncbi:DUF3520 domain-containing protein [Leptobacterium flavescens]|uniref:DUF3520 domain-containing protein n=1 Tax=Leptobacterium flavescens TaxID=472055 RepID=A0A6P0UN29_9FLAO|nr:VWA domain-containing protein [Leptobacterium flavescens]NER13870.1 DUF3520 domain-containing protein [Leptobacterium flavescens]
MKKLLTAITAMLICISLQAQQKQISGKITDQDGLPLPGANVVIKGTKIGTQSDFEGNYSITASLGQILEYSYVGMITATRLVGASNTINVQLMFASNSLDEVVITGYSTSTVTRSTTSEVNIRREKQKARHAQLARKLQGQAQGVQILSNKDNKVKLSKQEPLYIVDGVPLQTSYNTLAKKIDPAKIESLNVYKPNKATRLFGNIARNGCVVIRTKKGNYRVENDESYASISENQFEHVASSPLSTFSIDVDKASYSNIRRMINGGVSQIPADAVKIEEMINYFNYDYPQPQDTHPFSINTEVSQTPWNEQTKLVKIGLQGKKYSNEEIPPANLVFLIDVSGSMSSPNKLSLLKPAFKLLVNQLRDEDKVSIVVYAGAAGVVLEPTPGSSRKKILEALDRLEAGGSTAGGAGINLAYRLAEKNFLKNGNNRIILATDGDFNVGISSDKEMEELIEEKRKSGVFLSVLGFGMGNYKDSKLEILADKGNGNHAYVDNMQEAQKIFGEEFGGTLYTIAKDVKIQVEFNPAKVKAYRLIGYENRLLADEDFIDDTKDAGELGSGHTVTALYEVIPVGVESKFLAKLDDLKYTTRNEGGNYSDELLTVKFRYKKPTGTQSVQMVKVVKDELRNASSDLKFISAVALLGMKLRNSRFQNGASTEQIIALAESGRGKDNNGYRAEFIRLIKSFYRL